MNRIHNNSREAYRDIVETLPKARAAVFMAVANNDGITREGVAEALNWPINRVTGRVRELLDLGHIHESGNVTSREGRPRALLKAGGSDEQSS